MSDEGITRGIYEIFEIIMAVILLVGIGGAIIYVSNGSGLQAKATASEVSSIATLVSNYGTQVELKYSDTTFDVDGNKITVSYDDVSYSKFYFGNSVKFDEKGVENYILEVDTSN